MRDLERNLIYALTVKTKEPGATSIEALWDLMQEQLQRSKQEFDVVIIRLRPGHLACSRRSASGSLTSVVVPTIPDFLSTFGLDAFCANLWDRKIGGEKTTAPHGLPYVLATRCRPVNVHTRHHRRAVGWKHRLTKPSFRMFKTVVPEAVADFHGAREPRSRTQRFRTNGRRRVVKVLDKIVGEIQEIIRCSHLMALPCCARSALTPTHSAEIDAVVAKTARDLIAKQLEARNR